MTTSIGFLLHPREGDEAVAAARAVVERHGLTSWVACQDAERLLPELLARCRLLVTVGGDGTFLLGARAAAAVGVPLLGVNRGQLGFLTDIELGALPTALDGFLRGEAGIRRRALLELVIPAGLGGDHDAVEALALNEVAVKALGPNLARLRVDADGELLGEFDADGVIIATATGSTAYALSAGGPPIDPRVRAVLVVPLAPFAVLTRPVVLPEMTRLGVTLVRGRAYAVADSHLEVPLAPGARVVVDPGPELQVVEVSGSPTFLRRLREKMRLGTPLKQPGDDAPVGSPTSADEGGG